MTRHDRRERDISAGTCRHGDREERALRRRLTKLVGIVVIVEGLGGARGRAWMKRPPAYDRAASSPDRAPAPGGSGRSKRAVVTTASATMSAALPTHQMQIAWIVNTSR